jgi:hypothetical protein
MQPNHTSITPSTTLERPEKLFTPAEANSALVLVRRIVADIVPRYRRVLRLRDERQELVHVPGQTEQIDALDRGIRQLVAELNELGAELSEIGCVLKDWSEGLVDFPAVYQERQVWLCWRLDEPSVTHWHEMNAGFAGRQPIGPDFT